MKLLFFPVIGQSPETSWLFGLAQTATYHLGKDTVTRSSNFQGISIYTLQKQFLTAFNNTIYFPKEKYILTNQFSYSRFPDKFWGIGQNAPESSVENWNFNQYYLSAHLQKKIRENLFVGAIYEFQNMMKTNYDAGGLLERQQVLGRKPYHISGLGATLTYDNRNNAFAPDKGGLSQLFISHFGKTIGSDFEYTHIQLDFRRYLKTMGEQVFAVQLFGNFITGNDIPLRSLAILGGSGSMRGYYEGRYTDRQMVVLQSEYRVPIGSFFGLAFFGGLGDIAHDFGQFSLQDLKYSYGGGLRIALSKKEKMNLRIDYGITKISNGLYVQVGEAF